MRLDDDDIEFRLAPERARKLLQPTLFQENPGQANPAPAYRLAIQERLEVTLGLFDSAIILLREQLVRREPGISEEEILATIQRWLRKPLDITGVEDFFVVGARERFG